MRDRSAGCRRAPVTAVPALLALAPVLVLVLPPAGAAASACTGPNDGPASPAYPAPTTATSTSSTGTTAGLAAAQRLITKCRRCRVHVLEANPRVGGRVRNWDVVAHLANSGADTRPRIGLLYEGMSDLDVDDISAPGGRWGVVGRWQRLLLRIRSARVALVCSLLDDGAPERDNLAKWATVVRRTLQLQGCRPRAVQKRARLRYWRRLVRHAVNRDLGRWRLWAGRVADAVGGPIRHGVSALNDH